MKRQQLQQAKEINIELGGSLGTITGKAWGRPTKTPVLALHGWLDNAASFDFLVPVLLERNPNLYIIAIDLPGHGQSCHLSSEMGSFLIQYVSCILTIIDKLNFSRVNLLGHSMGAAVALLSAGTRPERINKLILLESNGPLTKRPEQIVFSYRQFLDEISSKLKKRKVNHTYNAHVLDKIISMRQRASLINYNQSNKRYILRKPVVLSQAISQNAARVLVERNMKKIGNGVFAWATDPQTRVSSSVFLTEKQVIAFIREIKAPACCIFAENSPIYLFVKKKLKKRFAYFKKINIEVIPRGGHHLHMEEPELTAKKIHRFLK